jgi:putative membrane protein
MTTLVAPLPPASRMPHCVAAMGGVLVLAGAWLGPLPARAQHAFAAHMGMHVAVIAIAAPLLAFGLAGSRRDPAARWPGAFAPLPASIIELVVVWAWHAPALHHAARHAPLMRVLEQGSFLAAGMLVWLSAFGGPASRERAAAGVGGLLLTSMHMTLLGVLLAGAPRALYAHADAMPPFGLDVLQDQQLGGVLMLGVGGTAYLVGALVLLAGLLRMRRSDGA